MKTLQWMGAAMLLMVLSFGYAACSSDDDEVVNEPIGFIRLDQTHFDISGEAQTFTVSLKVNNVPVTAVIQWPYPWVLSALKTAEEQSKDMRTETYTVTVEANDTGEGRTANVDFWVGSGEKSHYGESIFISQSPLNP